MNIGENLLKYLKDADQHTLVKDDILKSIDNIFTMLREEVIPTLKVTIDSGEDKILNNSVYLKKIKSGLSSIRCKDGKDFLIKLSEFLVEIEKSESKLVSIANKSLEDIVADVAMTPKAATIIRLVNDIGFMCFYTMDLVYFSITSEKESDFPKIKYSKFENDLPVFIEALNIYAEDYTVKVINTLDQVSTTEFNINDGNILTYLQSIVFKTGKVVKLPSGFTNNPFYHVRMWLVDREVAKYESLKDRKKMVELRLLELKTKANNEGDDESLRKQITYYENKISGIEYDMAKLQNK